MRMGMMIERMGSHSTAQVSMISFNKAEAERGHSQGPRGVNRCSHGAKKKGRYPSSGFIS